jgi:hypothetical protein
VAATSGHEREASASTLVHRADAAGNQSCNSDESDDGGGGSDSDGRTIQAAGPYYCPTAEPSGSTGAAATATAVADLRGDANQLNGDDVCSELSCRTGAAQCGAMREAPASAVAASATATSGQTGGGPTGGGGSSSAPAAAAAAGAAADLSGDADRIAFSSAVRANKKKPGPAGADLFSAEASPTGSAGGILWIGEFWRRRQRF